MHPVLMKIGPLTVYSYGVMVGVGFGLATLLIYRNAARFGLDKEKIIDLAIIILITGLLGARLLYIILNLPYYLEYPLEVINLSKGGLVWYGGFLAALIAAISYMGRLKSNFWQVADLFAPYIALAQSFGRVGCYLNGCCYGIDGQPVQIYSSVALLAIFIILRFWQDHRHFVGEIFLGYCILYSTKRFLMEFLRGDNPKLMYDLTLSQMISGGIFTVSLAIFIYKATGWKKRRSP